eukprot:TRINITY_DN10351_c0_g1_i1.p1 TRINITY_DN10351_c0_g1~~TRINITY_DN10351_c0_g1_i1.p1  ORF type:complete len:262 (-),score=106.94 TRINITY_DN10351_c0_g1_i1:72-776(-)
MVENTEIVVISSKEEGVEEAAKRIEEHHDAIQSNSIQIPIAQFEIEPIRIETPIKKSVTKSRRSTSKKSAKSIVSSPQVWTEWSEEGSAKILIESSIKYSPLKSSSPKIKTAKPIKRAEPIESEWKEPKKKFHSIPKIISREELLKSRLEEIDREEKEEETRKNREVQRLSMRWCNFWADYYHQCYITPLNPPIEPREMIHGEFGIHVSQYWQYYWNQQYLNLPNFPPHPIPSV